MDSSRMTFDEPPALRWESVILQGEKQQSLGQLAPVLLRRYPRNKQLQEAVAPWLRGGSEDVPVETKEEVKQMADVKPKVSPDSTTVITETPTTMTTTTQVQKIAGTNLEVEMVPVLVPKDLAEDAQVSLVATIASLRMTIAQHEKDLKELIAWRLAISTLSRAETAERTGANEPGENRADPVVPIPSTAETGASTIAPSAAKP